MRSDIPSGARPWIGWTLLGLVLLLIAVGWVVVRGMGAGGALDQAGRTTTALQQAIADGDSRKIELFGDRLIEQTDSARALTSDPVWRVGEFIPGVGSGMRALREVSAASAELAAETLPHLIRASKEFSLGTLGLSSTALDTEGYDDAGVHLRRASAAAAGVSAQLATMDLDRARGPFADGAVRAHDDVRRLAGRIKALEAATALLPAMLGDETARNYLVVTSSGPSLDPDYLAIMHLTTADGSGLDYERTVSAVSLLAEEPLPPGSFGEHAALLAERWQAQTGIAVDGVVAIDVTTLSYLLGATRDVNTNDGDFTATNVVKALTDQLAEEHEDPAEQVAVFVRTVGAIGNAALSSNRTAAVIAALAEAADDGHLLLWSAHEAEQERFEGSRLGDY